MLSLSLGPILWFWSRQSVFDFYAEAAEWPVDRIHLGETVCSRRRELKLEDWLALARELAACGKEVVLSSQTLIESEADLRTLRRLCEQQEFRVEANDQSAMQLLIDQGVPFVTGPAVNIYNSATLKILAQRGLQGWNLPVELSRQTLEALLAELQEQGLVLPVEVFAWGFLPLAWSSRCFTARHYNLPKDRCEFRCLQHPDGLSLRSRESQELFRLNGVSTLSGYRYDLLRELPSMAAMGVDAVRLSPEWQGMAEVVQRFDAVRRGKQPATDPLQLVEAPPCNGYWYGQPGMASA
ncbi:U32 family peptidase [Marinobacter xestospongiae]|uniref:U32 family peptidase n=1 Tax=Marinobacter xestospongiae TaxID=994319 RepID=UPI002005D6D9|nr:U32 family peptidase [Marinobacter xestospongiae]MCK7565188.1 U32 family peptidase [Marinobacter xestospongiae]